ncbi:PilN domain-containing protein [Serratia silvae]|uniref:PilN domain-containing protein n=1 Tax=Serratia silvae TaxID=2824122 RepID=A0ABT0KE50_9GAMM|nr:PilN domain-containing protein [Serratia silvae]MCL1030314.1 PilN domain-containing protein [Serratia silvae]
MYQVNLLPWRLRRQRQRYTFWLRCFVVQLLLVLAMLAAVYFLLNYQQARQHSMLQGLTQQDTEMAGRIQQTQKMMAELARLAAENARYQHNRALNLRYLSLLQQLSVTLPDTLWLTGFEGDPKGISLRGRGGGYAEIVTFERRLAALPLLQGCRLVEVTQRKEGGLAFTFTARWGQDG